MAIIDQPSRDKNNSVQSEKKVMGTSAGGTGIHMTINFRKEGIDSNEVNIIEDSATLEVLQKDDKESGLKTS